MGKLSLNLNAHFAIINSVFYLMMSMTFLRKSLNQNRCSIALPFLPQKVTISFAFISSLVNSISGSERINFISLIEVKPNLVLILLGNFTSILLNSLFGIG